MSVQMTPAGKGVLLLVLIAAIVCGKLFWYDKRPHKVAASITLSQGDAAIPDAPEASLPASDAKKLPLPSTTPVSSGIKGIEYDMGWQAMTGFNYANGGAQTTKGSIFGQLGFNMTIERQIDCGQSQAKIIQFCKDYKNNANTPFVMASYMGSGIPAALYNIMQGTKDLGDEYQPVCFMVPGKSYGEDQVMGDPKYKADKTKLKGAVITNVKLDGDEDLALKLSTAFGVDVNPDVTTYDPNALNLRYSNTYTDAAKEYNANVTEKRHLVINGKSTGRDTVVGIDLVATWTPGDVAVHNGPRGSSTVTIISTKEYASIMPAVLVTCKAWVDQHKDVAANLIMGTAIAGDQIRSFEDVKKYACGINAQIYKEESGDYWYKYYNGIPVTALAANGAADSSNHLGGSMVFNLPDMANMLGIMIPGKTDNNDIYSSVYTTFGNLQHKIFPTDLPTFPTYEKAFDKTILFSVITNHPELLKGKAQLPNYDAPMTNKVGNKAWHIEFETGSAEISEASSAIIDQIYNEINGTDGAKALLIGYTDNTGNPATNLTLSAARANSVMKRLIDRGLEANRFFPTQGRGDKEPIASNNTDEGKAQNRRVQISLLTK